jgi:hypothetical protein
LTVSVNMDSVNVKTSVITVVPNVPTTDDSTVVFNSVVLVEDQETVIVDIYDSFENEVIETQNVLLSIAGQGQQVYATYVAQSPSLY